ncbi:MAG TPA: pyridoxal-dependent decarboxylase [Thermoleophilaceae bacterium]|nr:pyridoxal-dependent decarboxylase [Thermoleophilaceae bacterium]
MDDYAAAANAAVDVLADHVAEARAGFGPATVQPDPDALAAELDLGRWIREGGMDTAALEAWLPRYLDATVRLHHPGSMAHQVAVPSTGAAVADLIHGATNNPMAIYEMGAAGATIEREVVSWMVDKVGFNREAGAGVLTHGGSLANLTALLAARARVAPDAWRKGVPGDLALLAPPSAHYSIPRAAAILGLGEDAVIELEVDELERIRPDRLAAALERCAEAGRRPLALVAPACATSTGLYDDLRAIGEFCAEHGIWLHVDAAHGASALLSERHRELLDGIELGDSVVWDAHKLLRTSGLCAAVLVRHGPDLPGALRQSGDYLFNDHESVGFDLLDRALETTKTTLGLKLFLSLAWAGEGGLGEYVASRFATALRFHELLSREPDVTLPYVPESNILCFRLGDGDQLALRDRLVAGGRLHIGSTTVNGERYLRLVVTAPDTDEGTLGELLRELRSGSRADLVL